MSLPSHITARCSILPFRCLSFLLLRFSDGRTANVPQPKLDYMVESPVATQVFLGFQHHIVLPQLQSAACSTSITQPLSLTQESHDTTPSGPAPSSQPSLRSIIPHFLVGLTRDVPSSDGATVLCAFNTPIHHSRRLYATFHLGVSAVVFTKHPFQRTVPLRLHEDLLEAQTPMQHKKRDGNHVRRCHHATLFLPSSSSVASSPRPSRRVPSPAPPYFKMHLLKLLHTVPLSKILSPNSHSQSSFLGVSAPMTHWIDSLLSLFAEEPLWRPTSSSQAHGCHSQYEQYQW